MPALVWIFRNSQRGFTRIVSSFVILRLSLVGTGALRFRCSSASIASGERALRPTAEKAAASASRRRREDLKSGKLGIPKSCDVIRTASDHISNALAICPVGAKAVPYRTFVRLFYRGY